MDIYLLHSGSGNIYADLKSLMETNAALKTTF